MKVIFKKKSNIQRMQKNTTRLLFNPYFRPQQCKIPTFIQIRERKICFAQKDHPKCIILLVLKRSSIRAHVSFYSPFVKKNKDKLENCNFLEYI